MIIVGCQSSICLLIEFSRSSLDSPKEVVSVLVSIDGDLYRQPV